MNTLYSTYVEGGFGMKLSDKEWFMNEFKIHHGGLFIGLLSSVVVTSTLFIALPVLTQIQRATEPRATVKGTLISTKKPKSLPAEDRDEPKKQVMKKKDVKKKVKQTRKVQPKFDVPKVTLGAAGAGIGGIQISQVQDFNVSDSIFMSAFDASEVDQPPLPLRTFSPTYPYMARRDNITGRIVLRFVVDVDGLAKEAMVVSAEPPEVLEIFKDAALKTLSRYKFKPAVKNGKAVMCTATLGMTFNLEE